jgi:hypothetical protein
MFDFLSKSGHQFFDLDYESEDDEDAGKIYYMSDGLAFLGPQLNCRQRFYTKAPVVEYREPCGTDIMSSVGIGTGWL